MVHGYDGDAKICMCVGQMDYTFNFSCRAWFSSAVYIVSKNTIYIQISEVRNFQSFCSQQSIPEFFTYKIFVGKSVACIS